MLVTSLWLRQINSRDAEGLLKGRYLLVADVDILPCHMSPSIANHLPLTLCHTGHSTHGSSRVAELGVTNRLHSPKVLVTDISTGVNHVQGRRVEWMGLQRSMA